MKFYKLRAIIAIYITKFFNKLLVVETSPVLSVAAIIKKEDKLLFINLSYQKGYGLPGGIVQAGETIVEALKREVFEETRLKITKYEIFGSYPSTFMGMSTLSIAFKVQVTGKLIGSKEGKALWLNPKFALGKMFYKDTEKTLNDYLKNE